MMLWVGPLCCMLGIRRSRSGRMDRVHMRGVLRFCLVVVLVTLAARCPRAMCPTAYIRLLLCALVLLMFYSRRIYCLARLGVCVNPLPFSLVDCFFYLLYWVVFQGFFLLFLMSYRFCIATVPLETWLIMQKGLVFFAYARASVSFLFFEYSIRILPAC